MKKCLFVLGLVLVSGLILLPAEGKAQMGPGMMGQGGYGDWNYCPYCGTPMGPGMMGPGYGMGPGMMGPGYGRGPGMMGPGYGYGPGTMHGGRGMGPGMMGPGYGTGPGMMGPGYGYGPQYQPPQKPLEEKDAKEIVENYVRSTRNPNLKAGTITDKDTYFEAEILTKNDTLVDKIMVDKYAGWMRSIY